MSAPPTYRYQTPPPEERHWRTSPAAVDIGGTLVKFVYWRPPRPPMLPEYIRHDHSGTNPSNFNLLPDPSLHVSAAPGALRFLKFPTTNAEAFVKFTKTSGLKDQYGGGMHYFNATGGGAFKYAPLVKRELGIEFSQHDEMRCLVTGLTFLLKYAETEAFTYTSPSPGAPPVKSYLSTQELGGFPHLVVNVGSGVSILKVMGEGMFERVSGSGIGGGTFWGLTKLLTSLRTWDEVLECCKPGVGDTTRVDLMVGDIYGGQKALNLKNDVTASYFGRIQRSSSVRITGEDNGRRSPPGPDVHTYRDADVVKSLLCMVADNVAQLGYLNAQLHGTRTIIFCGGYIVGNPLVWDVVSKSVSWWSRGSMQALFLHHDGYLGALGALLHPLPTTPAHSLPACSSE
eukprot:m51a1_g5057 putative pantothenate kinase (400) ;mRNA; r:102848-104587